MTSEEKKRIIQDFEKKKSDLGIFRTPEAEKKLDAERDRLIHKEYPSFERFCRIKDFLKGINLQKATLRNIDFHDKSAIKQTFESLVNKNNNK